MGVGVPEGAGSSAVPSEEEVGQITRLSEQEELEADVDDVDAIIEAEQIEEYQRNIDLASAN